MDRIITQTPIAVVDFETTGLAPGPDRVVEVSVVRVEPGKGPSLVLDTLVNPDRPMAATEIHGITDQDVEDAPRFFEVGGDFLRAIAGCVVASYNVYFDMGFLTSELIRMGVRTTPPHICLMYMRPLLGIGNRCSLSEACRMAGIALSDAHQSSADAAASAELWGKYLQAIEQNHLETFASIAALKQYKFLLSLRADPLSPPAESELPVLARPKSRAGMKKHDFPAAQSVSENASNDRYAALHRYWEALISALADFDLTRDEMRAVTRVGEAVRLTPAERRGLHAKAFGDLLTKTLADNLVDAIEQDQIKKLYQCLARLGWEPGQ